MIKDKKKKDIEQLHELLTELIFNGNLYNLAEDLYNNGYRKVNQNEVIVEATVREKIPIEEILVEQEKETVQEIWQRIKELSCCGYIEDISENDLFNKVFKEYEVEV